MPCFVVDFDYFDKLRTAVIGPFAVTVGLIFVGVVWTGANRMFEHLLGKGGDARDHRPTDTETERQREDRRWRAIRRKRGVFKAGVIAAAPFLLQIVDLLFPTTARTLLEYFTCRNLDEAGWFLEADYSVRCFSAGWDPENDAFTKRGEVDAKYQAYQLLAIIGAGVFTVGVPAIFFYLLSRYARQGRKGDRDVQQALGWMCTFRIILPYISLLFCPTADTYPLTIDDVLMCVCAWFCSYRRTVPPRPRILDVRTFRFMQSTIVQCYITAPLWDWILIVAALLL